MTMNPKNIFAILGCITGVIIYLTHGVTIYKLYNNPKYIESTSAMGMFTTYLGSLLWIASILLLGFGSEDFVVYQIFFFYNLFGVFFNFCWNTIYIYYFTLGKGKIMRIVYYITLLNITFEAIYLVFDILRDNSDAFTIGGWIASTFNILMHITPGLNLVKLFKEKNRDLISLPMVIIGFLNSGCWFIFALLVHIHYDNLNNLHLIIANSLGMCLCVAQFLMYYMFKGKKKKQPKQKEQEKIEQEPFY